MWTSSISRIALSTSLAVAGGLSLVGVLVSLPNYDPAPARPAPAVSGPGAGLDARSLQGGPGATARQTPELARTIDRVEAILAKMPADGPAADQAARAEGAGAPSGPDAGLPDPEGLPEIAPAAGWPRPASPGASGTTPAEPAGTSDAPRQAAERLVLDGDAEAGHDTDPSQGAVAGAYRASTIREGAQSAGTKAEQPEPADAADASEVTARRPMTNQAAAAASEPVPAFDRDAIGFVIIGSFQHQKNAARQVGDHRGWLPQILTKQIGGAAWYRVAVGPFRAADLPAARQRIIDSGITDAWLLPLGKAAAPARTLDILG